MAVFLNINIILKQNFIQKRQKIKILSIDEQICLKKLIFGNLKPQYYYLSLSIFKFIPKLLSLTVFKFRKIKLIIDVELGFIAKSNSIKTKVLFK